jgi:hypothetical protein
MNVANQHLKVLAQSIANWEQNGKECSDADLAEAYQSDVRDLWKVHAAMKKGDLALAAKIAFDLDTIVREQIPNSVYELLERELN